MSTMQTERVTWPILFLPIIRPLNSAQPLLANYLRILMTRKKTKKNQKIQETTSRT